jgi:hypothetical protein
MPEPESSNYNERFSILDFRDESWNTCGRAGVRESMVEAKNERKRRN